MKILNPGKKKLICKIFGCSTWKVKSTTFECESPNIDWAVPEAEVGRIKWETYATLHWISEIKVIIFECLRCGERTRYDESSSTKPPILIPQWNSMHLPGAPQNRMVLPLGYIQTESGNYCFNKDNQKNETLYK